MTPEQREEWKSAKAAVDAIDDERKALVAHTNDRWIAAMERLEDAEVAAERISYCEGCSEPIFEGDRYHSGGDVDLCENCAPSYQNMLDSPGSFMNSEDEPMTKADAERIVALHVEAGGAASDKLVSA